MTAFFDLALKNYFRLSGKTKLYWLWERLLAAIINFAAKSRSQAVFVATWTFRISTLLFSNFNGKDKRDLHNGWSPIENRARLVGRRGRSIFRFLKKMSITLYLMSL
jgi:hypothetical protein